MTSLSRLLLFPLFAGRLEWRDPDSNRGHHDFQSVYVCAALCRRFLKNCLNKRYLCTSWSVLIRRVLPDISYIVVKTFVNVRPIDQMQLAVPKQESHGVCPRTRSSCGGHIRPGCETRIRPPETRPCLVACLLVLPTRPHKLLTALLPILSKTWPSSRTGGS